MIVGLVENLGVYGKIDSASSQRTATDTCRDSGICENVKRHLQIISPDMISNVVRTNGVGSLLSLPSDQYSQEASVSSDVRESNSHCPIKQFKKFTLN